MNKKTETDGEIQVLKIETGSMEFCVLGRTPLILNAMSQKAKQTILLPGLKKNAAEKASTLKHSPLDEFRASAYRSKDDKSATRLLILATAFKGALRSAALDMPGAAKAQIGRLTYVNGDYVPIFGRPQLIMSVTRSADINKTPDVRTRCIVPQWACRVAVTFVKPILREQAVANLLAAAGIMRGVGDWRPEKGSGSYGQFALVDSDDADFVRIMKIGRKEQDAALDDPECYDNETAELLSWYKAEAARRGFKQVA
jgi:hypothetical protein